MQDNRSFIKEYVSRRIYYYRDHSESSETKSELARLRLGAGLKPGELPQLWGTFLEGLPEQYMSKTGRPSYAEWAIYLSLTLFAVHQQGFDLKNQCMNKQNMSLGKSAACLVKNDDDLERVRKRFNAVCLSSNMIEMSNYLRGLVRLLKSSDIPIPIDYANLAEDLYTYQFENSRSSIRLKWGQEFYSNLKKPMAEIEKDA